MEVKLFLGRLLIILGVLLAAEVINLIVHYVGYKKYKNWKGWYTFILYLKDNYNGLDAFWAVAFVVVLIALVCFWLFEPLVVHSL